MHGISPPPLPAFSLTSVVQRTPSTAPDPIDEPKNTTRDIDHFPQKPIDLTLQIARCLQFSEIGLLARTNKNNHSAVRELYRARLKPECQSTGNPCKLFENPANRLDQFVPIDQTGKKYLGKFGIDGPESYKKIQNGHLSIQQAAQNIRALHDAITDDLDALTIEMVSRNPVKDLVACRWIDVDILLHKIRQVDGQALLNLENPLVINYISNQQLGVEEALELSSDDLLELSKPDIQQKIDASGNGVWLYFI